MGLLRRSRSMFKRRAAASSSSSSSDAFASAKTSVPGLDASLPDLARLRRISSSSETSDESSHLPRSLDDGDILPTAREVRLRELADLVAKRRSLPDLVAKRRSLPDLDDLEGDDGPVERRPSLQPQRQPWDSSRSLGTADSRPDSKRSLLSRHDSMKSLLSDWNSMRSLRQTRVSFLDEELGLTPRHLITETRYRPRTADDERRELYYDSDDFRLFEKEEIYEKIEEEIRRIEEQKEREREPRETEGGGDGEELIVKVDDGMKMKDLMRRLELLSDPTRAKSVKHEFLEAA